MINILEDKKYNEGGPMNIPKKENGTPIIWSEKFITEAIDLSCGDGGKTSKEVLSILERLWKINKVGK